MAKYKLTKSDEAKLTLKGSEIDLVYALVEHVRLGEGRFSDDALNILEAIHEGLGTDEIESDCVVNFTICTNDGDVHLDDNVAVTIETSERMWHSPEYEVSNQCSRTCPGCMACTGSTTCQSFN